MSLDSSRGLCVVLRTPQGAELGRFPIDRTELRAVANGHMAFQACDGKGHGASMEGDKGGLKVRLDAPGHPAKNCRLVPQEIDDAILALDVGV